jgi:hypothetical protein
LYYVAEFATIFSKSPSNALNYNKLRASKGVFRRVNIYITVAVLGRYGMKIGRIVALFITSLSIVSLIGSCSGSRDQSGNGPSVPANTFRAMALSSDKLVTHATGSVATPLPDDQSQPAVAYNVASSTTGTGSYLVVWTDSRNLFTNCSGTACGTDIYGSLCTGSGTGSSTAMNCADSFPISMLTSTITAPGNQSQPKVALSSSSTGSR